MKPIINVMLLLTCVIYSLSAAEWSGHVAWTSEVEVIDPEQKDMANVVREMAPNFSYDCSPSERAITTLKSAKNYSNDGTYNYYTTWYSNDTAKDFSYVTIKHKTPTWRTAKNMDLDRDTDEKVKAFLAGKYLFATETEKIGDGGLIAGLPTTHYRITKSGFVNKTAQAEIWIHEDITLPRARWQSKSFTEEGHTYSSLPASPIPLSIPLEKGTILKAMVIEHGVKLTYTATEIKEKQAQFPVKPKE